MLLADCPVEEGRCGTSGYVTVYGSNPGKDLPHLLGSHKLDNA